MGVIGLSAAYVLIALLLISLNMRSTWHWALKTIAVIVTSAFYIITYISLPPLLGWPVDEKPPQYFELISATIDQPDKTINHDGAIYLWLRPLSDKQPPIKPRAYRLPYLDSYHEATLSATLKASRGVPQIGEFREPPDKLEVGQVTDKSRSGQKTAELVFYDMPDPTFTLEK